jgi:hypothetical protein
VRVWLLAVIVSERLVAGFFQLAARFVTLMLIVFVGEALREAFNPREKN